MIHHISIAARQPEQVAQVLAQLCQGQYSPFPAHEGSYVVITLDPHGTMIEVLPQGTKLTPNSNDLVSGTTLVQSAEDSDAGYNAFHAAISVSTSEATIHEIATRAGWRVVTCSRLGFFSIIEVWVENQQLLEFLPPNFATQYTDFMQPQSLQEFLTLTDRKSAEKLLELKSKN